MKIIDLLKDCIANFDAKNINYDVFSPMTEEYYKNNWLSEWISKWCKTNKIDVKAIDEIAKNTILLNTHYFIFREKKENPNISDNQLLSNLLQKGNLWLPKALDNAIADYLKSNNLDYLYDSFLPNQEDLSKKKSR